MVYDPFSSCQIRKNMNSKANLATFDSKASGPARKPAGWATKENLKIVAQKLPVEWNKTKNSEMDFNCDFNAPMYVDFANMESEENADEFFGKFPFDIK